MTIKHRLAQLLPDKICRFIIGEFLGGNLT